ncbi:MAG: hypothetical protein WCT51_05040, partial [Candidatus Shapirobacteria bacterium]
MLRKIVFGLLISNFLLFDCKPIKSLQKNLGELKSSLSELKTKLGTLNTKMSGLKGKLEGKPVTGERVFDPTTINDKTKTIVIKDEHQQGGSDSCNTIFDNSSKIIIKNNQNLEKLLIQSRAANDLTEVIIENNPKLIEVKIDGIFNAGLKKLEKIVLKNNGQGDLILRLISLDGLTGIFIEGQAKGLDLSSLPNLNKISFTDQTELEWLSLEFLPQFDLPDSCGLNLVNSSITSIILRKLDKYKLEDVKNIVEQLPNLEQLFLNSLKGNGVVEFEGTKNPNLKFSSMSGEFTGVDKIIFKNFI